MPAKDVMPSTVRRSSRKAQRTWAKTYDSALQQYGEGSRAARVANASLKHAFQKVGDRWEPKRTTGPSDEQAATGGVGRRPRPSAGGVDANASKKDLLDVAKRLDIHGRHRMAKPELIEAIQKANRRETRTHQPSAQRRRR